MYSVQYNNRFEVNKKQLSIHSEDRDITQWPNPNHFEVEAPVDYKNVVSLQLNDIEMPATLYVFSTANQNTKMSFSVIPSHTPGTNLSPSIVIDGGPYGEMLLGSKPFTIEIPSGTYTPTQMANELTGLMNTTVSMFVDPTNILSYQNFSVIYNAVSMKLVFINTIHNFSFNFTKAESYLICGPIYYDNYAQWGLGSYLGFEKRYISKSLDDSYIGTLYDNYAMFWDNTIISGTSYVIEAPNALYIFGDGQIYMELAMYNNIDEIEPYTYKSTATCHSKHAGKHNASFAKIPVLAVTNERWFTSRETFLKNIYFNDPPLERIQKFRFKFRYHDGRLVDFNQCNFNFTIEITMLRPDPVKLPIHVSSNNFRLS